MQDFPVDGIDFPVDDNEDNEHKKLQNLKGIVVKFPKIITFVFKELIPCFKKHEFYK